MGSGPPFSTGLCVTFGLRISECLALRWSDVDWLNQTLSIERRRVAQTVDRTKTDESQRTMAVDSAVLETLKLWKQSSQFSEPHDWIFASRASLGRLLWSYAQVWDYYAYASRDAGIGFLSPARVNLEGRRKAEAIRIHSDPSICARQYHVCGRDQAILDGKVWSPR